MGKTNRMETEPIPSLLMKMSLPAMLSMIIQALYNIVDSVFVSWYSEDALTALSLAFPIQLIVIAIAVGTGVGVTSLVSRLLGKHDEETASLAATHGIIIAIIFGIIVGILGLILSNNFIQAFTKDKSLITQGSDYIRIILFFSFAHFLANIGNGILRGEGNTFKPMVSMIIGAVSNIILDPILIFGYFGLPALGIKGAAYATIIARCISMTFIMIMVFKNNHQVHVTFKKFKLRFDVIKGIFIVGVPSIVMQILGSVMISGLNKILIGYSKAAVTVLGVYFKMQSFVFMPVFGLNQGFMPIVGYNYGHKNKERMQESIKLALLTASTIMILGLILFQIFPTQLLKIFNVNSETLRIGVDAFRKISFHFPIAALSIIGSTVFQSIGKGFPSLLISFTRQIIFLLPLAWLLGKIFGLSGTWFCFLISETVAVVITYLWLLPVLKKEYNKMKIKSEEI